MALIKIKIKRRSLKPQKYTNIFLDIFPLPKKKIKIPRDFGVVTACSSNLFIGLQMLITSLSHYYDVITLVWDVGLTTNQVQWCKRQPGVIIMPFKKPSYQEHISYSGAWFKPHYIAASPFKNTIWIDADAMVVGDLRELIDCSRCQALFTTDHTQLQETTLNQPTLYSYLPIGKKYHCDILPYLNSGVMVVHKKRDALIIDDWKYCVEQACSVKLIADAIACWDQGALKWALHKNDLLYLIVPDRKFNLPAKIRHFAYPATEAAVEHWIKMLKPPEPCVILHHMGSPKNWQYWNDFLDIDLSV